MTDTSKETIDALWVDYCEASRPTDVSDGGIELYNIESMDDAAYALYSALTKLMSENGVIRTEKHADAEAIGALQAERDAAVARAEKTEGALVHEVNRSRRHLAQSTLDLVAALSTDTKGE